MGDPNFHLDETMAAGLIANRLPGIERNRAFRHLLAGCPKCAEMLLGVLKLAEWTPPEILETLGEGGSMLSIAMGELDAINGELLWSDIERRKPKERMDFVRKSQGYQTFGTFRAGLAACRKLVQRRPAEAVEVAQLLAYLAEVIVPEVKGQQPLRFDWRADASMALARAKRAAGDFRAAESALDAADAFLEMGGQDEVDRAMYHLERGRLLADLGFFEEAVAMLDNSATLFRFATDFNSEGKVQLQQAEILRITEPARAFELAEDGLTKINLKAETLAEVSAHYTMAYCQAELGDTDEAESILSTYRYLIERQEEGVQRSFDWLQARIRFHQNRRAEAEQMLRKVQGWYLDRGFRFESVLTSIDLAEVMWQDDRMGEALYLVSEVLPILRAWGLHRDCLAVVARLEEKLETAAVEEGMFRAFKDTLRRMWYRTGKAPIPNY